MACDAPPRECLAWHILPQLSGGKPNDTGTSAHALCPAHADREHSLGISIGDRQRVTWNCFAGCTRTRVPDALIAIGVQPGCLPLVTREREDLLDVLRSVIFAGTADHAVVRLRAAAVLEGYADLPRGAELERVAGLASISRAAAYAARKQPPQVKPNNPSSYSSPEGAVKPRRSQAREKSAE